MSRFINNLEKVASSRWFLIAIVLIVGIFSMPRRQYIGDPMAVRAESVFLLNSGKLGVPEDLAKTMGFPGQYFYLNPRTGIYYSKYGILNTISFLPILSLERYIRGELPIFDQGALRTGLLNAQNILLSVLLAILLREMASLYTDKPLLQIGWVLSCLYCGFGWNYLRAQNGEILQWVLASAFMWALLCGWRYPQKRGYLVWAQIALVLAILTKGIYFLWGIVLLVSALAWRYRKNDKNSIWSKRDLLEIVVPLSIGAIIVLYVNYLKFGDPFASGYTQWERERNFFSGNVFEGMFGFLFSPDKSIFIYQPVLSIALWGWYSFWKRWPREAMSILVSFVLLFVFNSCVINWGGHWSYGPRYLLVALSPLSLPAIIVGERLWEGKRKWVYRIGIACCTAILSFSFWLQLQVNSLEFFTYYYVEDIIKYCGAERTAENLHYLPFGIVNYQLQRFASDNVLPSFVVEASKEIPSNMSAILQQNLLELIKSNYWFKD